MAAAKGGIVLEGKISQGLPEFRGSDLLQGLWRTSALSTIALAVSGVHASAGEGDLWQPQVRAVVGADEQGTKASIEGFMPIKQTAESVFFLDLRVNHDFSDGSGADIGFGIRRIVTPDLMLGGYGYFSLSEVGGNRFTGATLGVEAIGTRFDAHVNVHVPISGEGVESSTTSSLSLVSHQLIEQISTIDRRDYASWGIEGEFGVEAPLDLPEHHGLRLHIGGYHFADPDNSSLSVTGAKAGFEYSLGDVFGNGEGASLVLGGELRHDNRDDTNFAGTIRLSVPLGAAAAKGSDKDDREPFSIVSEGLSKRLNDRVRGDIGIRIDTADRSSGTNSRVAINAATNQEYGLFFFADGGNALGLGTIGDPTTLDAAIAGAGVNGVVVALGGAGNITTPGATLLDGQTLIGGGQSVQVALSGGGTGTFGFGGSNGTIEGLNPANNVVTLANGNSLNGVTITGGAAGIFGNDINGATLTNVTVDGAGANGAFFTGTSTNIRARNFTATNNGGSGLQILGDGAYSFSGITTLSDNAVDGFHANGDGTYAFQTLNAQNNGDDGIEITSVSGNFSTTGGTISGNGDQAVKIDPIAVNVVLDSISHAGGSTGIQLDDITGSFTVTGATSISGTSGAAISISDSDATVRFAGGTVIANTLGDGIALTNNSGSISFLGATTITNPGSGQSAVDIEGATGTVAFADLNIELQFDNTTGLDLSGATVTGNITTGDFDLLSASHVGTVGINLAGATGTGNVHIGGDATIGPSGANVDGPTSGVLLSAATSLNFTYGDGDASSITAATTVDTTDSLPLGGTYNFLDVTLNGDTANLATDLVVYYVDIFDDGINDGSLTNPGTILGAMSSGAHAIVLLDRTGSDTIDVADGGATTLVLRDDQRLLSFLGGDTLTIGGGAPSNFLLTGIDPGVIQNPFAGIGGAPVLTTTAAGANTVTLANNNLIEGVIISNGPGGSAVVGTGITGPAIRNSQIAGLSLTNATGTATLTDTTLTQLTVTGGGVNVLGVNADLTQAAAGAAVSVSGGHTGSVGFDALSSVMATAGNGLEFDNADGVYTFNGTTTLNGGDAGIDILNGSTGTFLFGARTAITSPSGTAFNLQSSAATVTYNGTITQNNAAAAVQINAMTGGAALFNGLVTANTATAGAVVLSGNGGGTISFLGGLNIDTTTGTGFTATGGGTVTVAATAGDESIVSTSGQAVNLNGVTAAMAFDSLSSSSGATGITIAGMAGSFTVSGATTITNPTGDGIALTGNSGTVSFLGQTTVTNPGVGSAAIDIEGANGAISFANLDIALQSANSTGLDASGAVLNGDITVTDFDLTSTTATGTTGVDISGTTRIGSQTIRLGDAVVAGQSASIAGVASGVLLSSATSIDFIFGDGEGTTDALSGINASTPISVTGGFPVGGTYNFLDAALTGDTSNLSTNLKVYYVDNLDDGLNDGSLTNPGTILGAINSGADAIVLLDRSGSDTIDIASGFQGGGTTFTLTLADGQRLYSFNGGDTINIGGGAPANFLLTGIEAGNLANPFSGSGAPVLTTTAGGFNTVSLANGNLLQGVVIANGPGGFAVAGTGIAGLTISGSSLGGLSLTTATGTATVTNSTLSHLAISGGSINFSGTNADLTNSANVAAVSISGGHTGSVGFDALSSVIATAGTGLQFDNADGSYTFNGTTTLNGGDAGIDILNGSGGTFLFGAGTSITSPSGTAFNLQLSTANVTYNGTITQNNAATAVQAANNTGGTVTFGGLVTANTSTAGAVVLTGNGGATVSFLGGLDIDTTTGTGLSATGGGTLNIAATAGNETINSTSGQAINLANVTVGITLDSVAAAGGARGIGLDTVGGSFTVSGITAIDDVTADGISIQNSSANATFGGRVSIRNDGVGANGDGVDLLTNTGTYAFNGGVDITVNGADAFGFRAQSSGTVNILDPNGTSQITSNNGTALFVNPTVINMTLANLTAANGANGISLSGASGSLTITGAVNISKTTAAGISIDNSTSAFAATFGGAVVINNAATAGGGVSATGNTAGALSFSGLNIDTKFGTGFEAASGGTFIVTGAGNSIKTGAGAALNMSGVTVGVPGMTFASTDKGAGGTSAVVMSSVSGTGTINLGTGVIYGGSGPAIRIGDGAGGANTGGTAGLIYSGIITNTTATGSSGRAVDIQDRAAGAQDIRLLGSITHNVAGQTGIFLDDNAAGSVTFSGGSKAITSGSANAVNLTDNAGAMVNFTNGGLVISTTSGIGFNATGGGTIAVTGAGNTISVGAGSGAALNVLDTDIGLARLRFERINANGATNGIVLNNTGTTAGIHGGLSVTGDGGANSGGTISNTTGAGVSLTSTRDVRFTDFNVDKSGQDGIYGSNVTNLELIRVNVTNSGDSAGERGVEIINLLGTATVTNSRFSGSAEDNFYVLNDTGTLTLNITGSTFSSTSASTGNDGILVLGNGAANMWIDISNSTFSNNRGDHIQVATDAVSAATMYMRIANNIMTGDRGTTHGGTDLGGGITISPSGRSQVTFNILNNNIQGATSSAITVNMSSVVASPQPTQFLRGNIIGNTIGDAGTADSGSAQGSGIVAAANGAGVMTVNIANNTVRQYNNSGISIAQRDGNGTLNATVTGNSIASPGAFAGYGLVAQAGAATGDAGRLYLDIANNTIVGSGANGATDFRIRQRFDTDIFLKGYGGGLVDTTAVVNFIAAQNFGATGSATVQNSPDHGFHNTAAVPLPPEL